MGIAQSAARKDMEITLRGCQRAASYHRSEDYEADSEQYADCVLRRSAWIVDYASGKINRRDLEFCPELMVSGSGQ